MRKDQISLCPGGAYNLGVEIRHMRKLCRRKWDEAQLIFLAMEEEVMQD